MTEPGAPALRCSFCGRLWDECGQLVKGRSSAFICEACVAGAGRLLARERGPLVLPSAANAEGGS